MFLDLNIYKCFIFSDHNSGECDCEYSDRTKCQHWVMGQNCRPLYFKVFDFSLTLSPSRSISSLSLCLTDCLCLSFSISIFYPISIYLSLYLSLSISISVSLSISVCMSYTETRFLSFY